MFTLGGLSFWTPVIIEKQYNKSSDIANNVLGIITFTAGIIGTLAGSIFLDMMVKRHYKPIPKHDEATNHERLKNTYTEYSCLFLTITTFCATLFALIGTGINTYGSYITGIALAEFFIFL